ncbi:hypothetical protein KJ596_01515 [Patescibacteria group bacterium]|nr:hypothetical protein [Patescibacteria group bacterium]MBU1868082.1 hypothetical protein [Patescibacteria group bacterium]
MTKDDVKIANKSADELEDTTPAEDEAIVEDDTATPATDETLEIDEAPAAEDTAAPAGDEPTPAGTDQQGRQLYSVKCSECGKQTEVPFKPSGDRPVYCRECYMAKKGR